MRYENPEMEILLFKEESIIVTSNLSGGDGDVSTQDDVGNGTSTSTAGKW